MFKILDGRKYFYQWDINRKLIVNDETIKEVHFCNRQNECSLVCEVYTENDLNVVDVPNIILQKNNCINVYAYDGEATRHSKTFLLKPRSKPEDYVYTETEIKNYETLKAYVDDEIKKVANSGGSGVPSVGITVDTQMSGTSENPVQNKVIKKYVDDIASDVQEWLSEQHSQIEQNIGKNILEYCVIKQVGKGLSTNDFTDEDKAKLDNSATIEYVNEAVSNIDVPNVQVDVDTEMSSTSQNAVQNKVIKAYVDSKAFESAGIDVDEEVKEGSINPVSGGAVKKYVDNKTTNPIYIEGANVENFYNQNTAETVTGKYIHSSGTATTNNSYTYFKVRLFSGKKYRTNITNIYSLVVFENNEFDGVKGTVAYYESVGTTQSFDIPEMNNKIVDVYITCINSKYLGDKTIIVEGDSLPVGNEKHRISFPWLFVEKETEKFVDPISIDEAKVENFYNPDKADIVTGSFINGLGKIENNASYMYCKVKLISGKTYNTNLGYNVVIFDNGKDDGTGNVIFSSSLTSSKSFTVPEFKEKVVIAYFSFSISDYNKVGGKFVVVEGETAPTGNEEYKISFPWLSINTDEEDGEGEENGTTPSASVSAYSVNEVKLKQKMPPYLFDGIEMDNYFDVDYMIANSTEDTKYARYWHTPYIFLPVGTYTINECYNYTLMSKDGVIGNAISSGSTKNPATFTITEDNPYVSFMIHVASYGVEYLRKISVQKGENATANAPYKYHFNEKFDLKDSVNFFPTHWNGKKYVAIGDSITYGYNPADANEGILAGGQMAYPYSRIVAENLNMNLFNVGESGANVKWALGFSDTHTKQVEQAIAFARDLVTIMLGVNDSGNGEQHVDLGTIDDEYDDTNVTFYSGLGEIVSRIQTALPNTTIVLLSSPKNKQTVNQTKKDYFNAVKDVAEKYDVQFYDLHNGCGFNINNPTVVSNYVLTDVHPNHRAHKVIGSRLTGFIASH